MDIVSSFSRHNGAKAEAASRVLVFDAMGCAGAWSTEDVRSGVRKRSPASGTATLDRCRQVTA
jgi:hypothetical protein